MIVLAKSLDSHINTLPRGDTRSDRMPGLARTHAAATSSCSPSANPEHLSPSGDSDSAFVFKQLP